MKADLRCVALESAVPWGRVLDLDVYGVDGRSVTRRDLAVVVSPQVADAAANRP